MKLAESATQEDESVFEIATGNMLAIILWSISQFISLCIFVYLCMWRQEDRFANCASKKLNT